MPISRSSFSRGCQEGSVVSIAEFRELGALGGVERVGEVTFGEMTFGGMAFDVMILGGMAFGVMTFGGLTFGVVTFGGMMD